MTSSGFLDDPAYNPSIPRERDIASSLGGAWSGSPAARSAGFFQDDDPEYRLAIQASLQDVAARRAEETLLQKVLQESEDLARRQDELRQMARTPITNIRPSASRSGSSYRNTAPTNDALDIDEDFPSMTTHSTVSSRDFDPRTRLESELILQSTGYRPTLARGATSFVPQNEAGSTSTPANVGGRRPSVSGMASTMHSSTIQIQAPRPSKGALNNMTRQGSSLRLNTSSPIAIPRRPSQSSTSHRPSSPYVEQQFVPVSSLSLDDDDYPIKTPKTPTGWQSTMSPSPERPRFPHLRTGSSSNATAPSPSSRPSSPWSIVPPILNTTRANEGRRPSVSRISSSPQVSSSLSAKDALSSPPSPAESDSSDDWVKVDAAEAPMRTPAARQRNDIVNSVLSTADNERESVYGILQWEPPKGVSATDMPSNELQTSLLQEAQRHRGSKYGRTDRAFSLGACDDGPLSISQSTSISFRRHPSNTILSDECMCKACNSPLLYGDDGKLDAIDFSVHDIRRPDNGKAQLAKRLRRKCLNCEKTFCRGCSERMDLVCLTSGPCVERCLCAVFETLGAFDQDVLKHIGTSNDYELYLSHPERKETFIKTLDLLIYFLDPISARREPDPVPNVSYLVHFSLLSNIIRHLLSKDTFMAWYKDLRDQKVYHKLVVFLNGMVYEWGYPELVVLKVAKVQSSCGLRDWMHEDGDIEFGGLQTSLADMLRPIVDEKGDFMKQVRRRPTAGNGRQLCQSIITLSEAMKTAIYDRRLSAPCHTSS